MKSGFFLSGTAHGLLIFFLVAYEGGVMPEKEIKNLEKLDIMILSEVEFDAMASLPPSIENFSKNNFEDLNTFSLNLELKSNLTELPNNVNQHKINELNSIDQKKEITQLLETPIDFIPETPFILEKNSINKEKLDLEINKLGNEINSIDSPTLDKPKSREADRVDRIASDNKNTEKISDDLIEIKKENSENLKTEKKDKPKEANKEATTKITPNAQKNVEIISGIVETSYMPFKRTLPKNITNSESTDNQNGNLQNTIDKLVESVNKVDENQNDYNRITETSISTMEKLKLRKSINQLIGRYWNKGILIGGSDFENYVVKVEILLDTEGNIIGNIRPVSPSIPYGRYAIAFREASNAIKAVGKIPIPSEKYKKGLKLKLTFDPALGIGFE